MAVFILHEIKATFQGGIFCPEFRASLECYSEKIKIDLNRHTLLMSGRAFKGCHPTVCDDGLHWVAGSPIFGRPKKASLAFSHSSNDSSLTTVQLGEERMKGVRTVFHRSVIFPGEAGLLDNGILSKYPVTIDSVSNRLLLEKSS